MRSLLPHCHLGLGALFGLDGRREQALEHLTTATTMYGEMRMMHWLQKARAEREALT